VNPLNYAWIKRCHSCQHKFTKTSFQFAQMSLHLNYLACPRLASAVPARRVIKFYYSVNPFTGAPNPRFAFSVLGELAGVGDFDNLGGNIFLGATGDPMLGPLADNGGPTKTHALLPSGPAIDAGISVPSVLESRPMMILGTAANRRLHRSGKPARYR